MKKIILASIMYLITLNAYAQTDSTNRKMSPPEINNTNDDVNQNREMMNNKNSNIQQNQGDKSHADGIMMQNGKVMMVKGGRMSILDHDMTMSNGTKVMKDGTCIQKDGTKMMLKEGQHIEMSGTMAPTKDVKDNKDKNMYLVPDSTTKTK